MSAYYNEHDPFAAAWLRELIKDGQIADGEVDERSIVDVQPGELRGYTQCHFFAGVGGWSLALRLAGWPDERPVWTGSCPCQPFSAAGKGVGADDPRHLWPAWFRLIRECRPATVLGEQVAAAIGHGWLDLVSDDVEGEGYAIGAVCLPTASVGAFHLRQRLWFVAESDDARHEGVGCEAIHGGRVSAGSVASLDGCGDVGELAHTDGGERRQGIAPAEQPQESTAARGATVGMGDSASGGQRIDGGAPRHAGHADEPNTPFWSTAIWHPCRDGKSRPVHPGIHPLVWSVKSGNVEVANGVSRGLVRGGDSGGTFNANDSPEARVGRLRGYGNAIVPEVAAEVIRAYMEIA